MKKHAFAILVFIIFAGFSFMNTGPLLQKIHNMINPMDIAGVFQNSGPLSSVGPLQNASPMQNAGPLQSTGPLQTTGPLQYEGPLGSPLLSSEQYSMLDHSLGPFEFRPYTINFELYGQQVSELLPGIDSGTLASIVNKITNNSLPPPPSLPPVIYNFPGSSNASPN